MTNTAYAIVFVGSDGKPTLGELHSTEQCAIDGISPLEGARVMGVATIELCEDRPIGMHFRMNPPRLTPNELPQVVAGMGEGSCCYGARA